MADKTIGDLTAASQVNSADLFVLEQNSTAKKLSGQTLVTYLLGMIDGHGGITSISWATRGTSGNGQYHDGTITMADGSTSTVTIRDGIKGNTGAAWYMHIRYAGREPIANTDMGTTPDEWMGIYSGTSATAPTNYTSYTWYRIRGDTGPAAQLVSRSVLYQASSSSSSPTGTWQSTIPALSPGEYLWTQVTLTFDSGEPVTWTDVSYQGLNGEGAVGTVNGVSPDSGGNVTVGAGDIVYNNSTVAAELASLASGAAAAQSKINNIGILKGAGDGAVSTAVLGDDYGARSFTVTLTQAGWNTSTKTQTAQNAYFRSSGFVYHVSPNSTYVEAYAAAGIYADDVSTNGNMTFHCQSVPDGGIVVNIARMVSA